MSVERGASRVALIATLIGSAGLVGHIFGVARLGMAHGSLVRVVAAAGLLVTVGVLIAGSLIYQACRFGYLSRLPEPDLSRFRGARELF